MGILLVCYRARQSGFFVSNMELKQTWENNILRKELKFMQKYGKIACKL